MSSHTHTMTGRPTGPYKDRTPAMQVDMHGQPTGEWAWYMGGQCFICGEDMGITMIVRRDQ